MIGGGGGGCGCGGGSAPAPLCDHGLLRQRVSVRTTTTVRTVDHTNYRLISKTWSLFLLIVHEISE